MALLHWDSVWKEREIINHTERERESEGKKANRKSEKHRMRERGGELGKKKKEGEAKKDE